MTRRSLLAALAVVAVIAASLTLVKALSHEATAGYTAGDRVDVGQEPELPEVAAPKVDDPISAAEMSDLQRLAEQSGAPLDEVIARYAWNDNFTLAVDRLRKAAPADYAGAAIVDARHAWVAFRGEQPEAMRALASTFDDIPMDVVIEIRTNVGFTERDMETVIEAAHSAVQKSPGVGDAVTSFDVDARQLTTTVTPSKAGAELDVAALRTLARRAAEKVMPEDALDAISITVVASDAQSLAEED